MGEITIIVPATIVHLPLMVIFSAIPAVQSSIPICVSISIDFVCKDTEISQITQEINQKIGYFRINCSIFIGFYSFLRIEKAVPLQRKTDELLYRHAASN